MRRLFFALAILLFLAQPCPAGTNHRIEVLQIGNADVYDAAYEGILEGLARQGLANGCNLDISRTIMDINPRPSLWERLFTGFIVSSMAESAIEERPDLVITLGTQATEAFTGRVAAAGIPVVFSGACSAASDNEGDSTGVAIRPQPADMIRATVLALPNAARLGVIHTPDPESRAFVSEMVLQARRFGITLLGREIDPSDTVEASAKELLGIGVDAFIIPPDSYYEMNGWKACSDLIEEATIHRIPCISAILNAPKGTLITLSPDITGMGNLTAQWQEFIIRVSGPVNLPS
jgi:putative ABC transport system substrate-binding protein